VPQLPDWRHHEKNRSIQDSQIASFPVVRDEYLRSLAIKGFSESTLRVREIYILMFLRWCGSNGILCATEVTGETLLRFQEHLYFHRKMNGHPLSTSSQYSRLALIRLWFRWMHRQGHIPNDPTKALELPRTSYRLPTVLTKQQVEKVLGQPDVGNLVGIRDRAKMEVLYSTGIRRTELLGLKIVDLDRERGVVAIREGKGKRDRTVPIGERALVWLDQYLSRVRPTIVTGPDSGVVFLTSTGASFTPNHLSWLVRQYLRAANIPKPGACHVFRHTMATHMLEGGADTRYIQEMLGHARLDTTQIYTHVSIRKLKQVHTRTHPSARTSARM
jgi:integrase/recombinase XerD